MECFIGQSCGKEGREEGGRCRKGPQEGQFTRPYRLPPFSSTDSQETELLNHDLRRQPEPSAPFAPRESCGEERRGERYLPVPTLKE